MRNLVLNPNPYGELTEESLRVFESKVGRKLPESYRFFLLENNGGKWGNNIVDLGVDGETTVHHIFGLHQGPDYSRLDQARERLSFKKRRDFLPIADDSFGNLFLISIKGLDAGSVYFCADDVYLKNSLVKLADGFDAFFNGLMSKEEWIRKSSSAPGYDDYKERLERFKRENE